MIRTREEIEREIEGVKSDMMIITCHDCDTCEENEICYDCDTNSILLDLEDELEILERELREVK